MSDNLGPWGSLPPPAPPPRPPRNRRRDVRLALAVVAALVIGAGFLILVNLHPERPLTGEDWAFAASRLALVVIVTSSLLARGFNAAQAARNALIWIAIAGVVLLGFSFRDEAAGLVDRLHAELDPSYAVATANGEIAVNQDGDGAFYVTGQVDGVAVRFLVDTGASQIVLSPVDARRLGVDTASLVYNLKTETANGVGRGAGFRVGSLTVGPVHLTNVPVSINQAPMGSSLLGMTFLKELASFEVRGHRLYLRARNGT